MNPVLRLALVASALVVLLFVTRKIRKAQFARQLHILAAYERLPAFSRYVPGHCISFSSLLGIQSPSNFIFLAVIALLLFREFTIQVQLSQLRSKVTRLCQEIALHNSDISN